MLRLAFCLLARAAAARAEDQAAPPPYERPSPTRIIETASPPPPQKPPPPPPAAKPAPPKPPPPPKLPVFWKDAEKMIGRSGAISGTVVATYLTKSSLLLHFNKDHPDYFTVIIPRSELHKFPKHPQEYYQDKEVLVEGTVVRHGGRPAMVLRSRDRIWVVGESLRPASKKVKSQGH